MNDPERYVPVRRENTVRDLSGHSEKFIRHTHRCKTSSADYCFQTRREHLVDKLYRICSIVLYISIVCFLACGCTVRKVSAEPPIAFQSETYVVVQTAPNRFTVITRSQAAMQEIAKRLGCNSEHVCANQWDGEVWTIQRLK